MNILVAYASKHGATEGIAARIATTLRSEGHTADLRDVKQINSLQGYDAAIIGSAVYYGAWMKEAVDFVQSQRAALSAMPVWLFSSGPLGATLTDGEEQPKDIADLRKWIAPRGHQLFFGALNAARLPFAERMVVKAVRAPEGDFRDWAAIESWAREAVRQITNSAAR